MPPCQNIPCCPDEETEVQRLLSLTRDHSSVRETGVHSPIPRAAPARLA